MVHNTDPPHRYIAFDLGNVLCRLDLDLFVNELVEQGLFKNYNEGNRFLESVQGKQDIGIINIETALFTFFPGLDAGLLSYLKAKWLETLLPIEYMNVLLNSLVENGFKIALLSNIGFEHAEFLRKACPIYSSCIQFFSCEVGARKPSMIYFKTFLEEYPEFKFRPYFDDRIENVDSANRNGLLGIQFNIHDESGDKEAYTKLKTQISELFNL